MSDNYRFKENSEERIEERVNRKKQRFMQINKKSAAMRRMMLLLPILLAVAVPDVSNAQTCTDGSTRYTLGTATTNASSNQFAPIYCARQSSGQYVYSYSQSIYLASEFSTLNMCDGRGGYITDIAYYYSATNYLGTNFKIKIYMATTSQSSFGDWVSPSEFVQVFSGSSTFSSTGWKVFHLSTPFPYDGTSNIVVAVDTYDHEISLSGNTDYGFRYTAQANNLVRSSRYVGGGWSTSYDVNPDDPSHLMNGNNATVSNSTYRPNTAFCIQCRDCDDPTFLWTSSEFTANQSTTVFPELVSNHPLNPTYTSSNTSVATINASTGAISIVRAGTTTITATVPQSGDTCDATTSYELTVEDHCTPSFNGTRENYYIRNFTATGGIVGINNTSIGTGNTYSDYYPVHSLTANNNASTTVNFSITAVGGTSYGAAIWIDYNNDGIFSNTERVWRTSSTQTSPITGSFTIPASATHQEYRMRVLLDGETASPYDPCNITQGEVEDYKIVIPETDCTTPSSTNQASQHIDTVRTTGGIHNINNQQPTSTPASNYTNYYDSGTQYLSATAGTMITLQVCLTFSTSPYTGYATVWVDWNNDGTFDNNATERVYVTGDVPSRTPTATFNIPSWVQPGEYRMRIIGSKSATKSYTACGGTYTYGEYEDYKIVVTNPTLTYANGNFCSGTYSNNPDPQSGYGYITLSSQVPTCSNASGPFAGWNTMPDGSGQYYQPNGVYNLTSDATLYAIFLPPCCTPDNAFITYTHGGVTDTARMEDDGYFYYNVCKGETLNATLNDTLGCGYSNYQWTLDSVHNPLGSSSTSSISHAFNYEFGYNLNVNANSTAGCVLKTKGRVRVSGGIHNIGVSEDHFSFCPGNVKPVTIGYEGSGSHVTVNKPGVQIETTLGHTQTIFLPDGKPCDPDGDGTESCSYVSSVTFTEFSSDAVVRDYNDILYLHMNMEHTYIGDLYIVLECPNGQQATVLNFGGNANTDCASEIPAGHRNWTGSSAGSSYAQHGGYMGNPDRDDYTSEANLCNSTLNQPGTGWNYVWSSNDNRGYTYAGGEQGFIYNQANLHSLPINNNHSTVDSSDLANMTQIYHPEESFANLVGCPLNGEWKIIVIDGFKQDNGYLFEWNLALSEDLMPDNWSYTVGLDSAWAACNWTSSKFNNFTVEVPVDFPGGDVSCILNYIDEYGCETSDPITLHFDIGELTATVTPTNATCGRDNGQIAVTSPAGVAPFTYSLNGGEERSVGLFTGLAVGSYTVRIKDSRGCYTDYDVEIENISTLAVSGLTDQVICAGSSVTLSPTVTGGTGDPTNYTWSWSPATGLSATNTREVTATPSTTQTYTVTVTDEDECSKQASVTITVNPRPSASAITINLDRDYVCNNSGFGLHTGASSATGGTPYPSYPYYDYTWAASSGDIMDDTPQGEEITAAWGTPTSASTTTYTVDYYLIVTDANGCKDTATKTITVYPLPRFTVRGNSPHCLGEDVELSVFGLTGGTPPYNDAIWSSGNPAAGLPVDAIGSPITAHPTSAGTFIYYASVTDALGCGASGNVSITFFNNPSVSDITYNPPTCYGGNDGSITVTVTNVAPSVGSYIEVQLEGEDADSHTGNVYTWTGLTAITYTLDLGIRYVTGSKTCNSSQELTLTQPEPVVVDATSTTPVCLGGSTTLTVTNTEGGAGAPYTYTWTGNGLSSTTGSPVTATPADATGTITYTVTAEDANHCPGSTTVNVFVQDTIDPNLPNYDTVCVSSSEANNEVTFTAAGTTTDYEYAWTAIGGTITSGTGTSSITVEYASEGTYTVTVTMTDKTTGCISHDKTVVTVYPAPEVTIADPGTICPNAGTVDITGSTSTTNANYTYVWSGDLTMTPATTTSSETTNITTATIPSTPCEKTYDITLTVTDGKGCKSHADRTVTVSVPNDFNFSGGSNSKTVNCTSNIVAPHTLDPSVMPTVTDGCNQDISSEYTLTTSPDLSGMDCEGTVDYVYTYTDCSGHTATWTFSYTVDMPAFDVPEPGTATVSCPSATDVAPTTPTVLDQCNEATTVTLKSDTGKPTCEGTRVYTYTYKDCANNSKDWTYTYNVEYEPFTISTEPGSSTVACINLATIPTAPAVKDNCNNDLTPKDTVEGGTYDGCEGTKTYTFGFEDCEGNRQEWVYTYTIERNDFSMPDPGSSTVACISAATEPAHPTVNDNCDNVITNVTGPVEGGTYDGCEGTKTYTWTYTDCEGNHHDWVYTYTIEREPFTISTEPSSSTVACINLATMPTAPAVKDNCNNDLTPKDTVEGGTYDGCEGTKTYTFGFEDCEGNRQTWTYTYTIEREPFSITAEPGSSAVACINLATIPTAPAVKDNCNNDLTPKDTVEGGTYDGCEGTKTYTFGFEDCEGNRQTWTYTYTIEREPFSITAEPGSSTVACINLATIPTAPAVKDNCNNDLTPKDTVEGGTYDGCEGTKTYTFGFEDCEGNRQEWVYTYTIERSANPTEDGSVKNRDTVACLADATAPTTLPVIKDQCQNILTPDPATPTENIAWETGKEGCVGTKTYTYNYKDCDNRPYQWVFTYVIKDTIAPELTGSWPAAPANQNTCIANAVTTGLPSNDAVKLLYTDCSEITVTSNDATEGNDCNWTITRTYTITDECGNTVTPAPTMSISGGDNTNPELTGIWPDNITGQNNCVGAADIDDLLSDNEAKALYTDCSSLTVSHTQDTSITGCNWTITRTYTITDACSHSVTNTMSVSGTNKVVLTMSSDTTICLGGTANLRSTATVCSGDPTYLWTSTSSGSGLSGAPNTNNISVTPSQIGDMVYNDTAYDANGCKVVESITVHVNDTAKLDVTNATQTVCQGGSITPIVITYDNATIDITPSLPDGLTLTHVNATKDSIYGEITGATSGQTYNFTVNADNANDCGDKQQVCTITISARTEVNPSVSNCGSYHWVTANEDRTYTATIDTVIGPYTDSHGCDSITNLHVEIYDIPTPTMDDVHVCLGESATLTVNETYSHYVWSNGVDRRDSTVVTSAVGETTYTVHVTDANGCEGDATAKIIVNEATKPVIAGRHTICNGDTDTLTTTTDYDTYTWTGNDHNDTLFVTATGDYTVTTTDANGCSATSDPFHVEVLDPITITENSGDATYCKNATADSLSFTAHGGDGNYTYQWQMSTNGGAYSDIVGANDTAYTPNTNVAEGTYTYRVSVDDGMGCGPVQQVIATITIRPAFEVTSSIAAAGYCEGATATTIGVTPTGGAGSYTYQWAVSTDSVAYSNVSTDSSYTPATATAGTYYYRITVTDSECGDTTLHVQTVNVWPHVGLDLVGDRNQVVCVGGDIDSVKAVATAATLPLTVTIDPSTVPFTYNETTGNIGFTTVGNANDVITVTVTAHGEHGCDDSTLTFKVTLSALTEINKNVTECGSYNWTSAAHPAEDETFDAPGSYDRTFGPYAAVNGCDSTTNLHVVINANPTPAITGTTPICLGDTAVLTTTEAYDSYDWDNSVSTRNDTIVPTASGSTNYTVTVTDGNGCSGTSDVFTLVVNDTAILSATNTEQLSVCQGGTITPIKITYDHGTIGFEYNGAAGLPAGLTYNASDSTITGTPTGVAGDELTFTIIDTNTNCGNKTVTCTIKISAITAVNVNVTECGSYSWTSTANPAENETFNTPGSYDRTFGPYTAVNGCDSTVNLHVVINANPTPVITGNNPICLGDTSVLTTTVAYDSYDWSNSVNTSNDTIVPTTSGSTNYTVTVTDGNGCSGTSDVFTLVVNDTAILSATNTEQMSVCQGGTITPIKITYDYGTIGFEYNGAAGLPTGLTYNASDSTITGSPDGVAGDEFTFTIIDTNTNCGNKTVTCTIKLDAVTAVNENVTACGSYTWTSTAHPAENETFDSPNTYDRTFGPYTAVNGCDSIVNLHVVINDNLTPTMDNDTVCVGSDAHLTVNGSYAHYVWGNGVDRQDSTITTTIAGETTYTVHVTDANGCSGDATAIVVVNDTAILSATNTEQLSVCQGGNITPIKITYDYGTIGFEYNGAAGLPAGLTYNTSDSTITGAPAGIAGDEFSFTIIDTNTNCGNKTVTCTIKLAEQTKDYDTIIGCGSVAWTSTAHPAEDSTFTVSTDMVYGPYTSSTGCDSTTYVHVVVNANPTPVINGNTPICLGDTAVLTTTEAYATYDWNNSVSTRNDTIVPTASGSTDYTVTVTDANGCNGTSAAFTLVVNDTAILSATNTEQLSVCQGGNITPIKITYDYGTIGFEYNSAAGLPAGLTYNASDSTITGAPAGVVGDEFSFTIIDTNTNCGNKTVTCTIKLAEQTKAYDTIIGCGSVAWTSTAHPEEDSTFTMSTDMVYGPYTSSTGCDSTMYVHVNVNGGTTPVFSIPDDVCVSASLTNDSIEISVQALTGYTYAWTIDGGIYAASSPHGVDGVSDTNRIVVRWADEGDKSVSVTLTNIANGCDGTATKTIHVHPVPGIAIAAVVGDICPHSGSVDLVANLDPTTTADYTYDWGGEVTVATTTPVTSETSNTATATIPTTSCDTTYNVGVSVVDGNGCKAVADSVTLVVRDVEAPTFTRPADDTIYKNDICEYDAAVAETGDVSNLDDNCTAVADLTVTHTDDTIAGSCYGATIIRRAWRVTDLCGNISDAADSVQTITVLDTVAPVIAGPMNEVNVEGCDESAVPAVSASDTTIAYMQTQGVTSVTDNCSDEAHLTVSISDGAMTGDCDHQVIRTYTVTDDCGNSSSISQTININRPAFMVPTIDTVNKTCENEAVAPTSIETVTLCGETFTAHAVPSEGNNRVATMGADGYLYVTYNYQFTDCKGDYDWHMTYRITPGEFTPEDSVYTTVACPSDIPTPIPTPTIIVCNETVPLTFAGVTTSDTARCGDSIYNYTYEVNGTTYHWAYIVRFTPGDFTMPTPGTQVVTCPSQVVAPNTVAGLMPEVQDACGNVITDFTLVSNDPIPTCDGDVVYTYRFVDCAGHSHDWTYTYTIEREDFTVPVPGSATVACAAEAVGAGESGSQITLPTVMPACSGEAALVPTDTIEGTMPQCEGEMTYTYVYEDCAGHTHNWVFTYNVKDSIAPTIVPIADRMADAAGGCQYMIPDLRPFVNATDNCGETHILSQTPDANTRYDQTTSTQFIEVVLVIADDCGNEVNDTVILTVPARNTTVSVNPNNPSICYGESVTLNANGQSSAAGESSYRWNPVNGLDVTTGATVTANPTATTTYTVTFTDGNGCEASASTIVTVNPQATLTADNLNQEVCVGGSITNIIVNYTNSTIQITGLPAGLTYRPATSTISGRPTASGEFTIRAISNYGCPTQELTGMITIADTVINTTTETACDYYVWSVTGGTYSTSGRYRNVNTASDGCISVDYLNLTINTQTYGIEEVSACDSYTWTNGNGQTYTNPTNTPTYTIHNGNAAGCDSTTTLHLTMHYSSNTDINESGCDSFTWYGTTYTNSTEAMHTLPSRWGCDSTLTLHLTINPSYHFDTDLDSICRGETYYYHGSQFIESGVYPITLHTHAGCDSVYTLGLTVLDRFTVEIEKSIDCITGTYTLTAISQSENYRWSEFRDHGQVEPQATQQSIEVAPPATTTYTVTVGYGPELTCPQSASITVDELITPTAIINTRPNHLSYDHPNWYADDASEGETDGREWYVNGEYYSQQSQHIDGVIETNPFGDDDSITLMLVVYSDLCSDTAEAVIPMIWSELWVPNVFTPSLDHNNLFGADGVGIIEYEIWIYTREGLRVFHSTSMDDRWDGKHEGTDVDCKQEAYTYRINYRFASKPEELQTKVGLVLLLR